jgi:hypothetical protein
VKSILQITVKITLNISPATKEYTYFKESSDLKTFSFTNNTSVTISSALLRHIHIVAKIAYYLPQGGITITQMCHNITFRHTAHLAYWTWFDEGL